MTKNNYRSIHNDRCGQGQEEQQQYDSSALNPQNYYSNSIVNQDQVERPAVHLLNVMDAMAFSIGEATATESISTRTLSANGEESHTYSCEYVTSIARNGKNKVRGEDGTQILISILDEVLSIVGDD